MPPPSDDASDEQRAARICSLASTAPGDVMTYLAAFMEACKAQRATEALGLAGKILLEEPDNALVKQYVPLLQKLERSQRGLSNDSSDSEPESGDEPDSDGEAESDSGFNSDYDEEEDEEDDEESEESEDEESGDGVGWGGRQKPGGTPPRPEGVPQLDMPEEAEFVMPPPTPREQDAMLLAARTRENYEQAQRDDSAPAELGPLAEDGVLISSLEPDAAPSALDVLRTVANDLSKRYERVPTKERTDEAPASPAQMRKILQEAKANREAGGASAMALPPLA